MPASRASWIGSLNASRSTIATAIPSALPAIAASKALTISGMSEVSEPVHWDVVPSSAEASSMPYCVGVKNGFVVTWLMNTKFHSGVSGKLPALRGCGRAALAKPSTRPASTPAAAVAPAAPINERRDHSGRSLVMSIPLVHPRAGPAAPDRTINHPMIDRR